MKFHMRFQGLTEIKNKVYEDKMIGVYAEQKVNSGTRLQSLVFLYLTPVLGAVGH